MATYTTNLNLKKPALDDDALITDINSNMDTLDTAVTADRSSLDALRDGLAIVSDGDTHIAITAGQWVYVKGHNTLPEGLYTAQSNIAANGALSTSNLTADSNGGLNALSDQVGNISTLEEVAFTVNSSYISSAYTGSFRIYKKNKILIAQGYLHINTAIPSGTQFITLTNETFANSYAGGHSYLHFGVLMKSGNTAYTILGDGNGIKSDVSALPTGDVAIILQAFLE